MKSSEAWLERRNRGKAKRSPTVSVLRSSVLTLLLSLVCLALMILDHRDQHLERVRQGLSVLVYPVRMLVDMPFRGWANIRTNFASRESLVAENERLKRDRLNAEFRLQRLAALESENARLRELLDSQARVGSRALIAEILAVDLDPYRQRFDLNRGLVDGELATRPPRRQR